MSLLITEALCVGIATVFVGMIVSYGIMQASIPQGETLKFEHWKSVALSFLITGIIVHLLAEQSGINKYYCSKGNACIKN
jgi:ABC-type enterochelin transport system permease subunit